MELNQRQEKILDIVKNNQPITGEKIAHQLSLTRSTLRPDLTILTMAGLLEAKPRVGYYYLENSFDSLIAKKVNDILIKDVQSVPIVVNENCSVYDAIVTIIIEDVGTLFVVSDDGVLQGVISRKDLLKSTLGRQCVAEQSVPVGVIMTRMPNVVVAYPEESVLNAARKLITHEIDALPIVRHKAEDRNKLEVVGRVSKTNITRLFVELGEKQ